MAQDYGTHRLDKIYNVLYDAGLEAARMRDQTWRRPRFYHLIQLFGLADGLEGATAEAGCFRGLSSFLLCQYQKRRNAEFSGKTHYIIDSFQGLSRPSAADGDWATERYRQGAFTRTSVEHVRRTLSDFPDVNIHRGWIPAVLTELPQQMYCFVHIDVDLYEPTIASFRYFYPRLVSGGIIVCDDYGPWPDGQWPGCALAVKEFAKECKQGYAPLDTGNAVMIKR